VQNNSKFKKKVTALIKRCRPSSYCVCFLATNTSISHFSHSTYETDIIMETTDYKQTAWMCKRCKR